MFYVYYETPLGRTRTARAVAVSAKRLSGVGPGGAGAPPGPMVDPSTYLLLYLPNGPLKTLKPNPILT